ncbi:MAG: hypothetical protein RLZZ228_890 [Actinomycetota bacterium]
MRHVLLEIWRLLDRRQQRRLILLQFVSIFMAFSTVAGIAAVMPFFAVLAEPSLIESNRWLGVAYEWSGAESPRAFVVFLGIALIVAITLANVVNLLGKLAMTRFAFWVSNDLQITLFNEYLNRDYLFHSRENSATLVSKTTWQVQRITNGILQQGINLLTNVITIGTIVGAIVLVNPTVAAGAALVIGGSYVLIYLGVRNRLQRFGQLQTRANAARQRALQEGFGGIKEIIVLNVRGIFRREFEERCWDISKTSADAQVIGQSPKHALECIAVGGLVGVALIMSSAAGESSSAGPGPWLAQLSFLGLAAYRLLPAMQQLFQSITQIRVNRSAFENIVDDLRLGRSRERSESSSVLEWSDRPRLAIELRNASFRYGADRPRALNDLNLSIPVGTTVGFVGPSGSGKTTTADIVLGLLVPECGALVVDGETIDDSNRVAWQSRLAYVPQHIFLTDGSVAENIAFGVRREEIDMDRIREAGRLAQIDEFVQGLDKAYDEQIGERGVRLSGGQRQRIGIARALYRQASVLVFDEATSALDGLTEQEVMSAIEGLQGQRTILLIAHRLTTVRHCDAIFEFENGRVARSGTYEELLATSERFRRMAGVSHPASTS